MDRLSGRAAEVRQKASLAGSGFAKSAETKAKANFKSVGLAVGATEDDSDSSDSDDGNKNKKGDNLMLDSAKFMRNLTKVTTGGLFGGSSNAVVDDDSEDEVREVATSDVHGRSPLSLSRR